MMKFKDGSVNPQGVKLELWMGLHVVYSILRDYGYHLIITSLNDAKHIPQSRHYIGYAADFRTWHISESHIETIFDEIREALPRYDVILEKRGEDGEHGHLEFDPRRWVI